MGGGGGAKQDLMSLPGISPRPARELLWKSQKCRYKYLINAYETGGLLSLMFCLYPYHVKRLNKGDDKGKIQKKPTRKLKM
jgi:hypothetical protein